MISRHPTIFKKKIFKKKKLQVVKVVNNGYLQPTNHAASENNTII